MEATNLGRLGALLTVFVMACTLDASGLSQASSSGSTQGTASSGNGPSHDNGDTQASSTGGQSCDAPSDCPGSDTACSQRTCQGGMCALVLAPSGTVLPPSDQGEGDCQQQQCDEHGQIVAVPWETDIPPDDGRECTQEICEGATPVHKPLTGSPCGPGSCNGTVWTPPSTCGDQGECKASAAMNCAPYQCDPSAGCKSACQTANDCAPGHFCSASMCLPKLTNRQACASADVCVSGFCVDQVCCNQECAGLCRACRAALTGLINGQCGSILIGTDPEDECTGTQTCIAGEVCSGP